MFRPALPFVLSPNWQHATSSASLHLFAILNLRPALDVLRRFASPGRNDVLQMVVRRISTQGQLGHLQVANVHLGVFGIRGMILPVLRRRRITCSTSKRSDRVAAHVKSRVDFPKGIEPEFLGRLQGIQEFNVRIGLILFDPHQNVVQIQLLLGVFQPGLEFSGKMNKIPIRRSPRFTPRAGVDL